MQEVFIRQLSRIYKGELVFPSHFIERIVKEFCRYKQNPMGEIYNEAGINNDRAYTNVKAVYDNIKLDFYHNLNN